MKYTFRTIFFAISFPLLLTGCGAAAAPCRVASAGLEIIPVIGGVLAAPTDGCSAAID